MQKFPYFPTRTLTQEDLDRFSDSIIKCYSALRFTSPVPRNFGVKNAKVVLPSVESEVNENAAILKENTAAVEASSRDFSVKEDPETVPKCFLHDKPSTSCQRCQAYVSWKRSPKRRKLD